MIAAVVAVLALYFSWAQVKAMRREQLDQLAIYRSMLVGELRSAVAFSDRETAREVLSTLDADQDLQYVGLFDARGDALYEHGVPSPWVQRGRGGVVAARTFEYRGRVAVVAPVIAPEGPRGTVVVELSQARDVHDQHMIELAAAGLGALMIAVGLIAAGLIAGSFTKRLQSIGEVAIAIARGRRDFAVEVDSHDEIGVLATAFNQMLGKLHGERERLKGTVAGLREAESQLERVNSELEQRVDQRTAELRNANSQLRAEMDQRSRMEIELRHAQKLESLGRLAAGVAHEINTPIQFAGDSVQFIRDSAPVFVEIIQTQRRVIDAVMAGDDATKLAEIARAAAESSDLDFLLEQLPEAAACSMEGLQRVAGIVQSMKVFSYRGSEMTALELNQAIAMTLTIARNEYKYIADVETDFGELPLVNCHAGEVNQAILNIVLNAAHAIEGVAKRTETRGLIKISTRSFADEIVVNVTDTGGGIPDDVRDRIFEPFFTTKQVGKGTGQGLAIAYSVIVDKHRGSLTFESTVGVGTTFRIALPLSPQPQQCAA